MIKTVAGILLIIIGILSGLYVGGYILLYGGIIQIITSVVPEVITTGIVAGLLKVLFAGTVGYIIASICVIPGLILLGLLK